MRALLIVNMLIALLDAEHIHHKRAQQWLAQEIYNGWVSYPLTQNGCLRIMSQQSYPQALAHPRDTFVADDYSLLDVGLLIWNHLLGHRQITYSYLLGLAVRHQCRFVTFDARLSPGIVVGAEPQHRVTL